MTHAPEKIGRALRWLTQGPLQMTSEQLGKALAKKPLVYLLDPESSYQKALQVAPEQWRSAEALQALLRREPQVLDLTHNCLLTDPAERVINEDGQAVHCDGKCTHCWRTASPKLMGQVLDGVEELKAEGLHCVDLEMLRGFLRQILEQRSKAWDSCVADACKKLARRPSGAEFQQLAEHLRRTGAAPSRERLKSEAREVRKALRLVRAERLLLPRLEQSFRGERRRLAPLGGLQSEAPWNCVALRPEEGSDELGLELLLYHGCRARSLEGILRSGFDAAFAGERGGRFFGPGIYFSDVAAKARRLRWRWKKVKGRQTKASCPGAGGREIEDKVEIQEKYVNIDSYLYIKFAVKFALQRSVVCIEELFWAMANQLEQIRDVLADLVRGQANAQWSRHVKQPEVFKPDTREQELKQWSDWRFTLENYVKSVDVMMHTEMNIISNNAEAEIEWNRPLKLIRYMPHENGYEAWRILIVDIQPSTRQRSLALMTQLSRVSFAPNRSISEQLPAYEALIQEYERISSQGYPDDLKVTAILAACPEAMRTQLQMMVDDNTTYETLKGRIIHYESITTKWTGEGGLLMPKTQEGPQDMDVGYLGSHQKGKKGKGKDGTGKKGKGKKGNPQYYEYQQKGKGKGKNGGWKGKAKGDKGGKAKGGKGECWNCGKTGHQAKDCWSKNVNRLEEESQAGSTANASSMASSSSASASGAATANVRMIRMFTPPHMNETRIFHLTAGDDDEFMQSIMEVDESQIYMVEAD
ncbi:unnamed protein product [Effrenium voratum]|uniref:CCHC-type domain-containing protein n=1 Tax=Effrenium voratum TaxID=2562239 RepID=A0AA36JCA1_9DINO|nr:unnamed protein product [Effrenium voratum]